MYWDSYDRVYVILDVDPTTGETINGKTYTGFAAVISLDVSIEGEEKIENRVQLSNWFSTGSAITYQDNGIDGQNIYLGIALDPEYSSSNNLCKWSPAIYLVDRNFEGDKVWRLRLDSTYQHESTTCLANEKPDHAKPDNM